eukprot:6489776-Amphidinium_carterae.2
MLGRVLGRSHGAFACAFGRGLGMRLHKLPEHFATRMLFPLPLLRAGDFCRFSFPAGLSRHDAFAYANLFIVSLNWMHSSGEGFLYGDCVPTLAQRRMQWHLVHSASQWLLGSPRWPEQRAIQSVLRVDSGYEPKSCLAEPLGELGG